MLKMDNKLTFQLKVESQLRIDQVIKINQLSKSYAGKISLLTKNNSIINTANLPSLITYLLTVKNGHVLNINIEGPFPQLKQYDLEQICSSAVVRKSHPALQPAMKVKIQ